MVWKNMRRSLLPLILAGLLCACGKTDSKLKAPQILEDQQQALQKARQAEQEVQKATDARLREIDRETAASKAGE